MTFKMKTLDLAEDINTTFSYNLPYSPESTTCHSCTRTIVVRVAAGVSQMLTAPPPRQERALKENNEENKESRDDLPGDAGLECPEQKQLRSFSFDELRTATNNFSEKNIVGQGGFGVVYKGQLSSGYLVAVKSISKHSKQGEAEFRAEVKAGKMVMHPNVVPAIGFCETANSKELLLVYHFMGNGSLSSHLYKSQDSQTHSSMDWITRKRIALGVAKGLSYLHDHCFHRIIHRDVKPSNILFGGNLEPRIADFGLARFKAHGQIAEVLSNRRVQHPLWGELREDPHESMTDRIAGTYPFMPPEYLTEGKYSTKTDVFAYGIMLLELISGCKTESLIRLAYSESMFRLADWVKNLVDTGNLDKIIDKSMSDDYNEAEVERMVKLSLICTQLHCASMRPGMSEVVGILEGINNSNLDARWEEFQQNLNDFAGVGTAFDEDFGPSGSCFTDSATHNDPEELSGPR